MARIALTAPRPRVQSIGAALRARGHEVLELALVAITALTDGPRQRELLAALERYAVVIFVSPTAVAVVGDVLNCRWPAETAVAVVGPGSREAVVRCGWSTIQPLLMPEGPAYDAEHLLALPFFSAPCRHRVLVVRAQAGNDWIERTLRARGAQVDVLEGYRRTDLTPDLDQLKALDRWTEQIELEPVHLVMTTIDAGERVSAWSGPQAARLKQCATAHAIHPRILASLTDDGWQQVRPLQPGLDALLAALESGTGAAMEEKV